MRRFILTLLLAYSLPGLSKAQALSPGNWVDAVPVYQAKITAQKPLNREHFTQGLEIQNDSLLLSSGQYGESTLNRYDFNSMVLRQSVDVPKRYFAEGLTQVGERIFQLTWRARDLLIYDANTLAQIGVSKIPTEGWGMTHNGDRIWYSDGSDRLFSFSASAGGSIESINVRLGGKPIYRLNELEWIDNEIWANVWQSNQIVKINPNNGEVTGIIDLTGLLPADERQPDTDVLNGIARDPRNGEIWVTGKRWPWIYRITLKARH